jgi:colanic acid/amylovoran biosynthesis glycosyltransferase
MNLAILSPSQNAYSETFIQAHKRISDVVVYYYYGGSIPTILEGHGPIASKQLADRIFRKISHSILKSDLDQNEKALLNSFVKNKIDCVLAEYGTTAASVLNVCKSLKLPLIAHFHGYDASKYTVLRDNQQSYIELFNYASAIVVVSKAMKIKLLELGCSESKLVYNPYGPDDAFYEICPSFNNKQFIGLGRFVDKKAPYYTILAFYKVLQKYPEARLVIGGDGPLKNTCMNLIRYLNIEDHVLLHGIIRPETFREYLKDSIAFVQHSITAEDGDMEGTPVGILEASSAGLPVISTFHAGIPDVIIHKKTGLLCKEHDVDGMAELMIQILDDRGLAISMGENGKKNIRNNFSMEKHLGILSELIHLSITL